MCPDWLSFPSLPSELSQPSRPADRAAEGSPFAELYSEAIQTADRESMQILSADSDDPVSANDPFGATGFGAAASALDDCRSFTTIDSDLPAMRSELMQQLAAIRMEQGRVAMPGALASDTPAFSHGNAVASPLTQGAQQAESPSGIHRLISWLDAHAHLHSTHHCAASVRRAMEAAGMSTADRPGDAGDYGPFLMRHGAQVIPPESYEPKAGDIAVFDKTEDHPAGHVQIYDGHQWVSDFMQHGFSPYRDQETTPGVTVYRLS